MPRLQDPEPGRRRGGSGKHLRGSTDTRGVALRPSQILNSNFQAENGIHVQLQVTGGKLAAFAELPPLPVTILHLVSNRRKEVNHSP